MNSIQNYETRRLCICGCGKPVKIRKYRTNYFIYGHNRRGFSGTLKESENKNTMYMRSKKIKKERHCEIKHIGYCKGMIDVCHINQDVTNNDAENLISLCRSHHRLMDNGKIDIKNPVMPSFYVDKSGKRRY